MGERKAVTREMARRYRTMSKKARGMMLDQLCELTGWHRDYARRALRTVAARPTRRRGSRPEPVVRRSRTPIYDEAVIEALRVVWAVLDYSCGKRMAAVMAVTVEALERHRELALDPEVHAGLLTMSAATIDRRLAPERRRLQIKGRTATKPGSLLKGQIPIRTFADWDDAQIGFAQVDLVAHDGGNGSGEFAFTLTLTDVRCGWTEPVALKNKAHRWVLEGIDRVRGELGFPLLGIDCDNGSEFINRHLFAYCADRQITFTRGRPYRKNDSARVEQKNWAVVRQAVGYGRYDTDAELDVLGELYGHHRLLTNFFIPQARLVTKTRDGAKVVRRYDTPATPYRRLLDAGVLPKAAAAQLTATYIKLNPARLRRDVASCQRRLRELSLTKIRPA